MPRINDQDLVDFHQAYEQFIDRQPWNSFNETTVFAFPHPEDGAPATASVMGRMGETFGVSVYYGADAEQQIIAKCAGMRHRSENPNIAVIDCHLREVNHQHLERLHRLRIEHANPELWPQAAAAPSNGGSFLDMALGVTSEVSAPQIRILTKALRAAVAVADEIDAGGVTIPPSDHDRLHMVAMTDADDRHTSFTVAQIFPSVGQQSYASSSAESGR